MAGDHRCPVCQSTFTRPQHVARHMRSHTGDRPYKCQHCGDAFARSDLLSRHVNKCHSAEKAAAQAAAIAAGLPPPGIGRKGRGAASTKAPCDQCILAKLQCNSGEPCSKCISKNIKCTYNQMNIAKSQHLPSLTLTQTTTRPRASFDSTSSSSSGSYPGLDYNYAPVVPSIPLASMSQQPHIGSTSDSVYSSLSNSLPPQFAFAPSLYSSLDSPQSAGFDNRSSAHSSPQYGINSFASAEESREVRADLLRRGLPGDQGMHSDLIYGNPPPMSQNYAGGRHSYGKPPDSNSQMRTIYNPEGNASSDLASGNYSRSLRHPSQMQHPELPPLVPQPGYAFGAPELSELNNNANYTLISNDGRPHTSGEGGFSSAFGLMSLDDQAVLAGYAEHSPFFDSAGQQLANQGRPPLPAHSSQASWEHAVKDSERFRYNVPPQDDAGYADVREFWSSYMRTPSERTITKKSDGGYISEANGNSAGERPGPPSRRVSRRASLPSSKSPPNVWDNNPNTDQTPIANREFGRQDRQPESRLPQVGNRPDELRAYEQAVLARGTPQFTVDPSNIGPRRSRTLGHSHPSNRQGQQNDMYNRPMLPMGRNAPFIGPQGPGFSSSESSQHASPVRGQAQLQQILSHQTSQSRSEGIPPPPTWEKQPNQRPKPKRNASQTLEQELQKSLRPSGSADVTGEHDPYGSGGGGFGSTDEEKGSPALSASASLSSVSRPGTGHSQQHGHSGSSVMDTQQQQQQHQQAPPPPSQSMYHHMNSSYTHQSIPQVHRRLIPEPTFQSQIISAYAGNVA